MKEKHLLILVSSLMMMMASEEYHNQFAVQVDGGDEAAEAVAADHGLVNKGQIGSLPGHYLMEANHLQKRLGCFSI